MTRSDIHDGGFADPGLARLILRRMRLRGALVDAQQSIAALLQLLDEDAEACRDARASARESGIGLAQGDVEGGVSRLPVDDIEGKDVREKELLEGVREGLECADQCSSFSCQRVQKLLPRYTASEAGRVSASNTQIYLT